MNRLPARATAHPFADIESALTRDPTNSPWVQSLNGAWAFALVDRPEATPVNFADPDLDDTEWARIKVPGVWNRQGFDRSIYTNIKMPWPEKPPMVPEENPTGLYRRTFRLPTSWKGRRIVLHFGGVESCFRVFVNGEEVGLAKDSRLPSEFDITPLIKRGVNTLAVQVIRWSDGSFLEDQDHWWMAGIHREVFLYSTDPEIYLEDIGVHAELDKDDATKGQLTVKTTINESGSWPEGHTLKVQLFDANGREKIRGGIHDAAPTRWDNGHTFRLVPLVADIKGVKPWTAETPNLYTAVVTLADAAGEVVECSAVRVGFRRVDMAYRELKVNGTAVMFKGVNRHDHHEEHGKTLTREDMLQDILVMKQNNFNAVRTSHYPNDPFFTIFVMNTVFTSLMRPTSSAMSINPAMSWLTIRAGPRLSSTAFNAW